MLKEPRKMLFSAYVGLKERVRFRLKGPDRSHDPTDGRLRSSADDRSASVPFRYEMTDVSVGSPIGALCQIFYEDLAPEFRSILENIPFATDVIITTDTEAKRNFIAPVFQGWNKGRVEIRIVPNRGRDIGPKLVGLRDIYDQYEIVLFLHSKKSLYGSSGNKWRQTLFQSLVGSPDTVRSIIDIFQRHPDVGMVICQHFEPIRRFTGWNRNYEVACRLARRMGIELTLDHILDFPSGSMFWARSASLVPLLDLKLNIDDFAPEDSQINETIAHAIERLFLFVCERAGYSWVKIADPRFFRTKKAIVNIGSREDLDLFLSADTVNLSNSPTDSS
jgi:lipopolysaccharide biosynthesis protein